MSTARKKKHGKSYLSGRAGAARKEFQESLHRRGAGGKFADKPGAGDDAPKKGRRQAEVQAREPDNGGAVGGVKTRVMSAKSVLNIAVSGNPKRGTAAKRFALYKDGMTIQDYVDAVGDKKQALRDLAWDMKQGWIKSPDAGTMVVRAPAKRVGGGKAKYKPGSDDYKSKNTSPVSKNARLTEDHQIYLEVGSNPKRAGAAKRFDLYKDGMTVRDYIDAVGDKRQALKDLAWDTKQGFVSAKGPGSATKRPEAKADTTTTGAGGTKAPEPKRPDVKPPEAPKTETKAPSTPRQVVKKPEPVELAEIVSKRSLESNRSLTDNQIDTMRRSVLDHLDEVYKTGDFAETTRLAKLHQDLGDLRANLNRERTSRDRKKQEEAYFKRKEDEKRKKEEDQKAAAARGDTANAGIYRNTSVYTAKNGLKAHIGDDVDVNYAEKVMQVMDRVPRHAAALLARDGMTTNIGKDVTKTPVFRKLGLDPTDRPSGYTEDSNFENCGGFYVSAEKTIAIGAEVRFGGKDGPFRQNLMGSDTMLHEVGHAYDAAAGGGKATALSTSKAFRDAYEQDVAAINKNPNWAQIRANQRYFLQEGRRGPEEVFAEGFFEITRGSDSFSKVSRIHDHFPRSTALIRKILDEGEKNYNG